MPESLSTTALPLRMATPPVWARSVLASPLELLNDHAHLEKKAAANALEMLNRWPGQFPPDAWIVTLTAIARDEIEHLSVVARLLARRGGKMSKNHSNPYAKALRAIVRLGLGTEELVDRLLVSALIEARSCERFALLSAELATADPELAKLYRGLWSSEHGHYLTFVDLAKTIAASDAVTTRWTELLDTESDIMQTQPTGSRMHSGTGLFKASPQPS